MNTQTQTTPTETIAAIATPPGKGGVGIIRVSGAAVKHIAEKMLGKLPRPRTAEFLPFHNAVGEILDQGIAIYFPSPHSFTGEDVLELQGHGGPVVLDMLLQECLKLGARMARPGEFSERAFLNDKLDLAQAEAIADLIEASSEHAARAALRSLQGEFSTQVNLLVEDLIHLRMYIEAAIDFPEEEIDFLADEKIFAELNDIEKRFNTILNGARQGSLLREGMTVVIAGRPNAGKSSLLNALAGRESAIVTDIAGTTRDVLREHIQIDGMPVHIIDTAGLRETDDQVEQIGVRKAWDEISRADRILLLVDDRTGITEDDRHILNQLPETLPITVIRNKCDLSHNPVQLEKMEGASVLRLSAKTGQGIDLLRQHLEDCVGYQVGMEGEFSARRRHLDALNRAIAHLENARQQLEVARAGELAAEELREAQQDLAEITGAFGSDELLGRIFTSFCIGK